MCNLTNFSEAGASKSHNHGRMLGSPLNVCSHPQTLEFLGTIPWSTHLTDEGELKKIIINGLPYSLPSAGSGADPAVQAVSLQVTF